MNPATGRTTPAQPRVDSDVPARLSQAPVAQVGGQTELRAGQDTTISPWTLLVPAGTVLTSRSTVRDASERDFQVVGDVVDRPKIRPQFRAASLRLISDLQ